MEQNLTNEILQEWQNNARFWDKYGDVMRSMFRPITRGLIEQARIGEGQSVLDVAGGTGEPSLSIAEEICATGSVTCTDAVGLMVASARREAQRRGLTNLQYGQCLGEMLPFSPGAFDAVVCRLGIMLFPDPAGALRDMLRVAKSDGRVTLAVWRGPEVNPFFRVVNDVLAQHVESPPEDPTAPGPFRFAPPGLLADLFTQCGATDVDEQHFHFHIEAPITPDEFWAIRSEVSDKTRNKLALLTPDQLARVGRDVKEAVGEYFPHGTMDFPAQVLIVTGRK